MSTSSSTVAREQDWVGATNPVLPGFHPDPSVCRVGEWFYLVTSTFEYLPGLPVHRSRDLVSWELVGHVVTDQLSLAGVADSDGLYAPTIRHDGERFLMVCKRVGGPPGEGENFVVTAPEAHGPWSDPVWWTGDIGGDTSLLIDGDRIWAHGARQTERQDWPGQGEVWVREMDRETLTLTGPEHVVFTSAVHGAIWTEGPHLYRRGDLVHLVAAEGGTGRDHAVVTGRSLSPTDVVDVAAVNPVLTHRHLGPSATVVNVGHADLVEAADGTWWALVLASRLVDGVDLLGRETFLVPAAWVEGTLVLAPGLGTLAPEPGRPSGGPGTAAEADGSGRPRESWIAVRRLPAQVAHLDEEGEVLGLVAGAPMQAPEPAFLGRRLLSPASVVSLEIEPPQAGVTEAGLAVRQSGRQWVTAGLSAAAPGGRGATLVVTRCVDGLGQEVARLEVPGRGRVAVAISGRTAVVRWEDDRGHRDVVTLDVAHLSTTVAHGFVGVVVGPYAVGEGVARVGPLCQRALGPDRRGGGSAGHGSTGLS